MRVGNIVEVLPRSEPTCGQEWTWYRACDLREDHDGPHASVSLSGLVVDVRPNGEDE